MKKIEHLGIAVKDIEAANDIYEKLFGAPPYKQEEVRIGESKIELLASTKADGPIGKFLEKRGEGIHHIAFDVEDIYHEMERLEKEGFQLINKKPKRGADNKLVAFVHPKSSNGVLIELCQEIKDAD